MLSHLSLTLFDLVVLLGVIQGIVTALTVWVRRPQDKVKQLYGWILLILSLLSVKILLHTLGLWEQPTFRYFPLAIDTTLQPLLYLYTCALTKRRIPSPPDLDAFYAHRGVYDLRAHSIRDHVFSRR